jgi:hypothetical protein
VAAVVVPALTAATARVATAAVTLARRLRALLPASSSLSSVVASGGAVAPLLLKRLTFA